MKKQFYFSAMAAAAMLFTACTNDEIVPAVDNMTDTPVTITANVENPITRAGMTTDGLANLGLFITNSSNTAYSYQNIKFEKTNEAFTLATGQTTPLWQNATQSVHVVAYAPYTTYGSGETISFSVQTDQTTTDNVKASDLVFAAETVDPAATEQTGNIQYDNGALNIALQHKLSKLTINLRYGSSLSEENLSVSGVTINGVQTGCDITLANGTVTAKSEATNDIKACTVATPTDGYVAAYEAILIPQTITSFKATIAVGERNFQFTKGNVTLDSGKSYILSLLVGKDKVEIDNITVGDWTPATDNLSGIGDGLTEEVVNNN